MRTDYDGHPVTIVLTRDLTGRKLMQARLLQSDRMASLGTLAAGIAHEINNPLAYVKANLDLLALRRLPRFKSQISSIEGDDGRLMLDHLEEIETMVELAREGAERVRTIVSDLRTFSRGDDGTRVPVDLARTLDASANLARREIESKARLVKDYQAVPVVWTNESRLAQVFLNLLVNAAQAIPEGVSADQNAIRLRIRAGESGALIEVEDTGIGIPEQTLARVFDPFFSTKPAGVGTGLGLWICQGIIASLGGQISLSSQQGSGTLVRVSIPYGSVPAAGLRRASRPTL